MCTTTLTVRQRSRVITANRWIYRFSRYWLLIFSLMYGLFVGMPFLAPVLMQIGWQGSAKVIYFAYSWLCHQMPQRSFFMFGQGLVIVKFQTQSLFRYFLHSRLSAQVIF